MSIRKLFALATLTCALPLAACGEEDPRVDPSDDDGDDSVIPFPMTGGNRDSGSPSIPTTGSDGGVINVPGSDAGIVIGSDAGQPSSPDGSVPATAQGSKYFLPTTTPTNTAAPTVEIDGQGNVHMVYPQFVRGNAFYAVCAKDHCTEAETKVVEFETEGTTTNAMITLTRDGKPRVLFSAYAKVYYGECDANCGVRSSWQYGEILNHGSDKQVTGEALTLDQNGHPRFLIHTTRTLFGIGQKPAQTELAQCDAGCSNAAGWTLNQISDEEIWEGSTLRIDAGGKMHVASNVYNLVQQGAKPVGAYLACDSACTTKDGWHGIGFFAPFESTTEAVNMYPAVSLALTKAGHPRFAQIHKNKDDKKTVSYFECENDCTKDNWIYAWSYSGDNVDSGLDLALDAQDHPRIVHTVSYNIAISSCDDANCATQGAKWNAKLVEDGGTIPADQIFLEWNCTVGAWFLHDPSIAIGSDGKPVVGYQARDVSGGTSTPNPNKPSCVAGTDMTWSRLAVMSTTN